MLRFFQEWKRKKEQKKILLEFYGELKKNLESYYVMDQLGRFRLFRLEGWKKVKTLVAGPWDQDILHYAQRLAEYNAVLDEFTKYEQWYAADIDRKTPDNARVLHDKREEPRKKFQGLEPVIKSAIEGFERYLQERKISFWKYS